MKVVVGLGNPGRKYQATRHNVGFAVLDELARRLDVNIRRPLLAKAGTARARIGAEEVLLVKPETFMNLSGGALAPLLRKRGLGPGDLIVVVDDAELAPGRLRIRPRGGAVGHNGLKSIIQALGSEDFVRVRVGIGRAAGDADLVGHVLGRFSAAERRSLEPVIPSAADAVVGIVERGVEQAMNRYNGEPVKQK